MHTIKRYALAVMALAMLVFVPLQADAVVSVKGYYKKNGTYVAPHYRSDPDGIVTNNWSYPGNTNPYTGVTAGGSVSTYGTGSTYSSASSYALELAEKQLKEDQDLLASLQVDFDKFQSEHNAEVLKKAQNMPEIDYRSDAQKERDATFEASKTVMYEADRIARLKILSEQRAQVVKDAAAVAKLLKPTSSETTTSSSCPSHSSQSGSSCTCDVGYVASGSQCVSGKEMCTEEHGSSAYFNADQGICYYCETAGYVFDGSKCIPVAVEQPVVQPQRNTCAYGFSWNDYLKNCIAVAPGTQAPTGSSESVQPASEKRYVTTRFRVNIRISSSATVKKLGTVNAKTRLEVIEEGNGWTKVQYGEKQGWIRNDLVVKN